MAQAFEKLKKQNEQGKFLCVGLDPNIDHARKVIDLGAGSGYGLSHSTRDDEDYAYPYVASIIDAAGPYAAAFKFNFEFWWNPDNDYAMLKCLSGMISRARSQFPDAAIILDRKFGDIAKTSGQSVRNTKKLGVDAVTISPYMSPTDVTEHFTNAGIDQFVLARTSNPNAGQLQSLALVASGITLGEYVAMLVADAGHGLVAGATHASELAQLSSRAPNAPLLIPGVGTQRGDLAAVLEVMRKHDAPSIVNVGGGIAEASSDPKTWKDYVANAAKSYHDAMKP